MSNTPSTAVSAAPAPAPRKQFQDLVVSERFQAQLAAALPTHLTPDRFTRVLLTATLKNPLLLQCTQESMFKGILDAAATGLEIDGRRAHLIPYKNNRKQCYEAQLIIDYKGIAELALRSGVVAAIHADIVCESDEFDYDRGRVVKHKIDLRKPRGEMYAAYVIITMKDGSEKADVMSKHEVEAIRSRSRSGNAGPWVTDFNEMAKKTVFRRASKWIPLSPEIRAVVDSEADDEPVNVTPQKAFSDMLGAATAPDQAAPAAEPVTEVAATESAPEEQATMPRAQALAKVEELMLDHKVTESAVLTYAHANGLAVEGQDEIDALSTLTLEKLVAIIPTMKKGAAK